MRYARRTDANQSEIVEALRAAGAIVKVVHQPYDLRVWAHEFSAKSIFMEVKNKKTGYGRKGMNAKQAEESIGLPVAMVTDIEGALRALEVLRK